MLLIKFLANYPRAVEAAAQACEPHRIAFYLMELAALFHGLWHKGNDNASLRFIVADDKNLTLARLVLIKSVQTVLQSGLAVMGCKPIEEMRSDKPAPPELFRRTPGALGFRAARRACTYAVRRIITICVLLALIGGGALLAFPVISQTRARRNSNHQIRRHL